MSNIVKFDQTVIAEPFSMKGSPKPEVTYKNYLPIDDEAILLRAREEANSILQDTETMVQDILEKAREEARKIIAEAEEAARLMEASAVEEAKSVREDGLEQGYQEGIAKAILEKQAEMDLMKEENIRILEEAQRERLKIINTSEEIIVKMALSIAKKIVDKEVMEISDITKNIVNKIMEQLSDSEAFKIFVSPKDFEFLAEKAAFNQLGQSGGKLQVKSDSRITDGGCIIDSDLGIVDARLETRVTAIENALLEGVKRDPFIYE